MSSDGQSLEELVPVQVPRSMLTQVYGLLSGHFQLVPAASGGPSDAEESGWSIEDFQRLLKDSRPSTRRMIGVLDVLAANPDTPIPLSDLARQSGLSVGELRGGLSGFTRVLKSLWPDHEGSLWPMRFSWGQATGGDQDGEARYTMDTPTAEMWITARGPRR